MRSKAPLALMEQMVMLLVFALAAALCLQAFVKSDRISLKSEAEGHAALVAQDVAELLRHSGKDLEHALSSTAEILGGVSAQEKLLIDYDENWNITEKEGVYHLTVEGIPEDVPGLQKVQVSVTAGTPEEMEDLFQLEAAWLEVSPDE